MIKNAVGPSAPPIMLMLRSSPSDIRYIYRPIGRCFSACPLKYAYRAGTIPHCAAADRFFLQLKLLIVHVLLV